MLHRSHACHWLSVAGAIAVNFVNTSLPDSHYTVAPSVSRARSVGRESEGKMWSVQPEGILASASAESAISAETEATAAAAAPVLLGTTPMGADPDSAMFSAALNGCGASYLGVVSEHAAQRGVFAGAQGIASGVYVATEAARAAASGL